MRALAITLGFGFLAAAGIASELHEGTPKVTVQMTAATLAGDCDGGGPSIPTSTKKERAAAKSDEAEPRKSKAKRRCEQTSMQLSVIASAGTEATNVRVKKVELFDETGKLLGELVPRTPTVWSEIDTYVAWDERVTPPTSLSVSYALSQPDWSKIEDRWNRTFVVKAVVTVGGSDQTVQRDVQVAAETSLPPGVKT